MVPSVVQTLEAGPPTDQPWQPSSPGKMCLAEVLGSGVVSENLQNIVDIISDIGQQYISGSKLNMNEDMKCNGRLYISQQSCCHCLFPIVYCITMLYKHGLDIFRGLVPEPGLFCSF